MEADKPSFDTIYELFGKTADLFIFCQCFFPETGRPRYDGVVFPWDYYGNRDGIGVSKDAI